jgi:hypothetical protein
MLDWAAGEQLYSKALLFFLLTHSFHHDDFNITLEPLRLTPLGG